jgi:hypothetical protein
LFAPKQRQQDFDPLMRLHVGEDRQPPSERTAVDPDMVAAPKRAGFGQLHQASNLSATDLGYNPIGNVRWSPFIISPTMPGAYRAFDHCSAIDTKA